MALNHTTNPISLTQQLIACPSITPAEGGALTFVADFLAARGFAINRLDCGEVSNLYARLGSTSPHFCFAGHTDVVPPGDISAWSSHPFSGELRDGNIYGRGVVDMKGAIAAFLAAIDQYLHQTPLKGSVSVLLTSDEEGPAIDGVQYVVRQFKERGEQVNACLVGEPTSVERVGDTLKIGRRGSLNVTLTVRGKTGHVAYPHLARNPIPLLLAYLQSILYPSLDEGMANFDPSHIEVTSIDVANPTANVIPWQATAKFNIRFNPLHTPESLTNMLHAKASQMGLDYTLESRGAGGAFLCRNRDLTTLVSKAVASLTGKSPVLSTSGGTSDARFLKDLCPVVELGLINATAHQADEHCTVEDIQSLTTLYQEILKQFFLSK
jgi:succinyl-diaminopimelate desuccinylase